MARAIRPAAYGSANVRDFAKPYSRACARPNPCSWRDEFSSPRD